SQPCRAGLRYSGLSALIKKRPIIHDIQHLSKNDLLSMTFVPFAENKLKKKDSPTAILFK
ncbi:hypothetical protein, partial [Algoriphagus aquimarinus]|uniref:hypothetical protein n=1 Tax=Algoriphagus aquimarinus TaxID=237018 RepID=UPI0030DD56B8